MEGNYSICLSNRQNNGMQMQWKKDKAKKKEKAWRNTLREGNSDEGKKTLRIDLAGPIDPVAKDGFRYAITFVDDYTGIFMVYFLKQKSDATKATEIFLADAAPFGNIRCIRTDNGSELSCQDF